ncbi:MAG TPA: MATE family efflux transporter [Verrucomicrobiae bacterium]|nr:MATE family efflux transporter [Verrucomicrobiae bacterium]
MSLRIAQHLRLLRREVRPTLALALPIMAGMVSQMLMGLADTIMVGRVGVVPLAAASFVNAVAHLPLVFGLGLLSSIAVLTSQAYGARKPAEAGELLRYGLILSIATGLMAMLVVFALHPFLHRLGQPPEVASAAGTYLLLFGVSLFPALVAHGCKQFSEALKHPWAPTFVMLGGVLLNAFLNWILIYGNWGAPAMGLEGAGWATVVARLVMMLVLIAYVVRAPSLRVFQPIRWRAALHGERFQKLLKIGWPVAGQHLFEVSAFAFAAIMMGWISADAIAAHQIAITCAAFSFMFVLGLGAATCIRVGHAYGAGQFIRMRRIGWGAIGLAAGIMATFGAIFMIFGKPIAGLFISSPAVVQLTAQLLIVAAVFQIADGVQVTAISASRGLADVRVPAFIAVFAYWVLAIPLGSLLAFKANWGAVGIWTGLATGLGAAAVGLAWRFHLKTRETFRRKRSSSPSLGVAFPEHGALP